MAAFAAGHRLVGGLGVHADHLGVRERLDEVQHVPGRWGVDVPARLVRLGLQREACLQPLRANVLAEKVDAAQ
jgi:hypothetical protein